MLITPRPGAHRDNLRQVLGGVHTSASNLDGRTYDNAYKRLLAYLNWATESARMLRSQISDRDIDQIVFTARSRRCWRAAALSPGPTRKALSTA